MSHSELLLWLQRYIAINYPSRAAFCRAMDILPQQLYESFRGKRKLPKRLLRSLNIETKVSYQLKGESLCSKSCRAL